MTKEKGREREGGGEGDRRDRESRRMGDLSSQSVWLF